MSARQEHKVWIVCRYHGPESYILEEKSKTRHEAEEHAKRLAKNMPTRVFSVFELTSAFYSEAVLYACDVVDSPDRGDY